IFESPHPYLDNTNEIKEVSIAGAEAIKIVFDPQSKTELNCDYLVFYRQDPREFGDELGSDNILTTKLTGGHEGSAKNFPTFEQPLIIAGSKCFFKFYSDGSANDWGWRFMATACSKSEIVTETSHFADHTS